MTKQHDSAVSPVVGVMMMLVVVIIIAAIVSAFAGGMVSSQKKVPQATFSGKFSLANGFQINHDGGDSIATADLVFVVRNSPLFGPNLEQKSAQILNASLITNSQGQFLNTTTALIAGDSLFISPANTNCSLLQPNIASSPDLCFNNASNIGKTFSLEVSDTRGDLISKSEVKISP